MRESEIEKRVCDYAKAQGILVRKFVSPSHKGMPDRMFIFDGKVQFIEFKRPGEEPTLLQMRELRILNKHGVAANWASNYRTGVEYLDSHLLGDNYK